MSKKSGTDTMAAVATEYDISEISIPIGNEPNEAKVRELADSIKTIGLIYPIVISPDKEVLAGVNRISAYKLLGYTKIPATVRDVDTAMKRLTTIDENLVRKHLDALEQGLLFTERNKILSELGLLAKAGDNKSTLKSGIKTTKDLAKSVGKSERAFLRTLKAVKNLDPEAIDDIRGTQVAKNEKALTILSHQDKDIQLKAAKDIKDGMAPAVAIRMAHREKTRNKLEKAAKNYSLPDSVQLYRGDFREVTKTIPDNSIQLVLSDPEYCKEALKDYKDLAIVANRVLVPGGFLVAYCGTIYFDEILESFKEAGLIYHWVGGIYYSDGQTTEMARGVISKYRPVLFFRKEGGSKPIRYIHDMFACSSEVALHHYQQVLAPIRSWIVSLTEPGDTVLSCFLGTGTVGVACVKELRKFIGIDIDEKMYATAEARIKSAASEDAEETEKAAA